MFLKRHEQLLFLALTYIEPRSYHSHPYKKETLNNLQTTDFLDSSEKWGCMANQFPEISGDSHIERDTVEIYTSGAEASEVMNWHGCLKGIVDRLLESECGLA